jgi:putative membrane protein
MHLTGPIRIPIFICEEPFTNPESSAIPRKDQCLDNDNPTHQKTPEDPRVRFAGERTLLAWIRTGLAMMGFGFVVARFGLFLREIAASENIRPPVSTGISLWIGIALVVLGVIVNLVAAMQHFRFLRRLDRDEPYQAPRWSLGVIVSVTLAVLGIGMIAYLVLVNR